MERRFEVRCDASDDGQLHVKTNSLSVRVGQVVRRNGTEEMWDSVLILCEVGEDGKLSTKVVVCHPDWDQQLQIASIESDSRAQGKTPGSLNFDFTQVRV